MDVSEHGPVALFGSSPNALSPASLLPLPSLSSFIPMYISNGKNGLTNPPLRGIIDFHQLVFALAYC